MAWDDGSGGGESLSLLGAGKAASRIDFPVSQLPAAALRRNFWAMSVAFALNHGCVTVCLAYASSMLGNNMGSVSSGCLYVSYAASAFLLAKPLVAAVGPKNGLSFGVIGYCLYTFCFLLAVMFLEVTTSVSWMFSVVGGIIGGVAGGLLWTAQGRYFARSATLYAQRLQLPLENVNADMIAIFATAFLGIETAAKLLATAFFLLFPTAAPGVIFSVYSLVALCSVGVVVYLEDLDETGYLSFSYRAVSEEAGKVARLMYLDRRLALLLPFQVAFGFASSFVPYYVFGTVIDDSPKLGSEWVGLLSAVIVLTGSAMALPSAWAANKFGKPLVMSLGGLCLTVTGLVFFMFTDEQLGTWDAILPYLVIYGMGRGIWETINKAVIADFYASNPDTCTTAFAAATFFNGYASAMGYFTFASLSRLDMAGVVAISSFLSLLCYEGAFLSEKRRQVMVARDEVAGMSGRHFTFTFLFVHTYYSSSLFSVLFCVATHTPLFLFITHSLTHTLFRTAPRSSQATGCQLSLARSQSVSIFRQSRRQWHRHYY